MRHPVAVKVKNTEQDPSLRVHIVESKVPVFEVKLRSESLKVTVPLGDEPLTTAVHFVHEVKASELGVQVTDVTVGILAAIAAGKGPASTEGTKRTTRMQRTIRFLLFM